MLEYCHPCSGGTSLAAEADRSDRDTRTEEATRTNAVDLRGSLARRVDATDAADMLGSVFAVAWRRRADLPADPPAARMWPSLYRALADRSVGRVSACTAERYFSRGCS